MSSKRSSSDLDALSKSARSKPVLLGVLLLGALSAAIYTFATAKGKGVPEDPTKILVVDVEGGSNGSALPTLERNGFVGSEVMLQERWQARADDEGIDEEDFVLAMLELADTQGFGYVAFDQPHRFDFSGIEDVDVPDPRALEEASYAVVSVGELAHPHVITLGPPRSPIVRVEGVGLLEALLAHDRFDPEREILTHRPSVDELKFEEEIGPARLLVEARARIEREAREMAIAQEEVNYAGIGLPLLDEGQAGGAVPLADGSLLEVARGVDVHSRNGRRIDLSLSETITLARSVEGAAGSVPLGDLPESMGVSDRPEYLSSPGGSHLAVKTAHGSTLFRLEHGGFVSLGEVALADHSTEAKFGNVTDDGTVLRPFVIDGAGGIRVYWPDGTRAPLGPVEGVALASPRLLWSGQDDAMVVAAIGMRVDEDGEAEQSLFLLGPSGSGSVYEVTSEVFSGEPIVELGRAAPASGGRGATLYAVVGADAGTVVRLELGPELIERVSTLTPPDGEGWTSGVVALTADDVALATIARSAGVRELAISPDGAYAAGSTPDHQIVAIPLLEPSETIFVPVDSRSGLPRFTADSSALIFESRVTMGVLRREVIVPRIVYLDDLGGEHVEDPDT